MAEEVLETVDNVRFLKKDGTVVVTSTRVAFQPAGSESFDHSFNLANIKQQRVTPDTKAKVQLQVVLNDDKAFNFQFTHKTQATALRDRNKVRDCLQQLLATQKHKISKDFATKNKLLSSNPRMLQLYRDLVARKIITPEDFWQKYGDKALEETLKSQQSVGVNPSFLSDVQPQIDAQTGSVKYRLTSETIDAIFSVYPSVKRKYELSVESGQLSENEFWSKFFQSHYFYRDRKVGEKDAFIDCIRQDDKLLQQQSVQRVADDPAINMRQMTDAFPAEEEGYGSSSKRTVTDGSSTSVGGATATTSSTSSSSATSAAVETAAQRQRKTVEPGELIKRFNQHSLLILHNLERNQSSLGVALNETIMGNVIAKKPSAVVAADGDEAAEFSTSSTNKRRHLSDDDVVDEDSSIAAGKNLDADDEDMPLPPDAANTEKLTASSAEDDLLGLNHLSNEMKRRKLAEMVHYDDLSEHATEHGSVLDLSKSANEYKLCPSLRTTTAAGVHQSLQHAALSHHPHRVQIQLAHIGVKCLTSLSRWRNDETGMKPREIPSNLLSEITQSKQYDFVGSGIDIDTFPKDLRDMLRNAYASISEVLRHFWLCFPVLNLETAEKLERLRLSVDKVDKEVLQPLREKLLSYNSSAVEVMNHLDEMLRVARERYDVHKKKNRNSLVVGGGGGR